uniref:C-type lectin domain-containing protein n=1 Tax=Branchiostoma floridae TaxID=7739 RepID=C3Z0R2_BRAFL|eukprot:XP_002597804.1 hypothetical protein BRAFLDRAFT_100559 [Branchiostoma floridae]
MYRLLLCTWRSMLMNRMLIQNTTWRQTDGRKKIPWPDVFVCTLHSHRSTLTYRQFITGLTSLGGQGSWSPNQSTPNNFLQRFQYIGNMYSDLATAERFDVIDIAECARRCYEATDYYCQSFEVGYNAICYTNENNRATTSVNMYESNNFVYYERKEDIDACLANPCDAQATCTDNPAPALDATCTCNTGYTGDGLVSGTGCADYTIMHKIQDEGGTLAMIKDEATQTFLRTHLRGTSGHRQRSYWIGLDDRDAEGTFLWNDGTPLGEYDEFRSDAPNRGTRLRHPVEDSEGGSLGHHGLQRSQAVHLPAGRQRQQVGR